MAEEDRLGVELFRLLRLAVAGEFVVEREGDALVAFRCRQRRVGSGASPSRAGRTGKKCPRSPAGLSPAFLNSRAMKSVASSSPRRADAAALQLIAGKVLDVGADTLDGSVDRLVFGLPGAAGRPKMRYASKIATGQRK